MKNFLTIRSLFPNLLVNYITDPENKSVSPIEEIVFDLIEEIIIIVDDSGLISYISPSSQQIFGDFYQSLLGKNISQVSKILGNWLEKNRNRSGTTKIELINYQDQINYYNVKAQTDKQKTNRTVLFLKETEVVDQDPNSKEKEVSTAKELKLFKDAVDNIYEGIIITTAQNDFPIVYVNDQFLKEIGYSRDEVLGKNARFLQGEKTDPKTVESVRKAIEKNEPFRGEIINYRKDGSYFHNLMTINPIYNEHKEVSHFVGLQSNISYKVQIEEALKESVDSFNYAVKATNDVLWDWDFVENQITWYSAENKVFGYNLNEIGFSPDWKLEHIHPDDRERVYQGVNKVVKEREDFWKDEYRFKSLNGNYLYIRDRACIIYDQNDNVVRMIGAKQDISNLKKVIEEQTNLVNELSHRNIDLQQFSYIVSHNLRGSIARIKGLTTILNYHQHEIPQETQDLVNHITHIADNLDETLKDLSEILKIRSDYKEKLEEVDLEKAYHKVKLILQDQIELSNAEMIHDFTEVTKIVTIKSYLFSILFNLISNAIKYRSPAKKLKVETSAYKAGDYIVLMVRDNGIGINMKMQKDKIFGLYKRLHPHIEGKGLGLYLVKTQAESMGGKVELESEEYEGSTFKVYLKSQH